MVWQTENWSIAWFYCANEHHTFLDQIGLITILDTLRVSVGKPFRLFGVRWGTLFEVYFFTTFEGNRVTAATARELRAGVWGH